MHRSPRRHLPVRAAVLGGLATLLASVPSLATALPESSVSQPAAVTAAATAAPRALAGAPSGQDERTAAGAGPGTEVTLVTGDTVTLGPVSDGRPTVSVAPAEGAAGTGSFTTLHERGDVYVVPDDVAGLVPRVLDIELFNVTALAAMDYDDTATDTLPLIVRGPRPLAALDEAAGSRRLPSIDATAVDVPKDAAAGFAERLTAPAGPRAAAGVTKVWLDREVRAAELDWNLGMIGAPEAWEGGLSGAGVDVAVLDSGIDAAHPDLRGQVAAAEDFTGGGSTGDPHGHGTHVASLVAGTGAAADGARRGVAHGAKLLNARVLDEEGRGQSSWVIAGMEWATAQGAEVANLSLGAQPGAGDDPVALALDALTADTGTLFVAAAGNSGPFGATIQSPGIADSALTVGAAVPSGRPAHFSSAGPTLGTYRAKPDVMAPGAGITAARSGGGTADPYTTMDGTSQATPHVAGAAALLLEKHPDWSWERVKTALMTTADGDPDRTVSHVAGAGMLDLPGAVSDTLEFDRGNVDFGYLRHPEGTGQRSVEFSVTNHGTQAEHLDVSDNARDVYDDAAPDDLVTLSPARVTVEPGQTRRITATLTPAAAQPRVYHGGVVVKREGRDTVTLPLNVYLEPPRHDIRLTVLDRHGEPWAGGTVWVANMDDYRPVSGGGSQAVHLDGNGQGTARLLPGSLSVMAKVETPAREGSPATVAFAGSPEVMLDRDMEYTVDARQAKQLRPAEVAGADTRVGHVSVHYQRRDARKGIGIGDGIYATGEEVENGRVFLQPTGPVERGTVAFETRWRLDATGPERGRQADVYELVLGGETVADPPVYDVSRAEVRDLARLTSDYRSLLGRPDRYVESRAAYSSRISAGYTMSRGLDVPRRRTELVTAGPEVSWRHCVVAPAAAGTALCGATTAYERGERDAPVWFRGAAPAVVSGVHYGGSISLPFRHLSDGRHHGEVGDSDALGTGSRRLYRDGVEVQPRGPASSYYDVPPEPATFRLEHTSRPDPARLPIGTRTETSWTFPSRGPGPGGPSTRPRLLAVDYRPPTRDDGTLRAGVPLVMGARMVSADSPTDWREENGRLRLWVSTDSGERWHRMAALPLPDGSVLAAAPGVRLRAGDSVSLRVEGSAAEGRTVDQTIVDAYPVR
ncbi:S8 family serine peptidase [Streptomyces sp. WMMC500]|uniref:S8 family serine peptidase n=1 Tax=Streptomyces sp. WMMC500 TaxID=3015154 RepID=UPI00248B2174|nr:S8 family serine peptidase [Streptomyces sp. WMMC500]WBB61485.1 S8 family serine peptidase [Streptomyces sp. WMMC500]